MRKFHCHSMRFTAALLAAILLLSSCGAAKSQQPPRSSDSVSDTVLADSSPAESGNAAQEEASQMNSTLTGSDLLSSGTHESDLENKWARVAWSEMDCLPFDYEAFEEKLAEFSALAQAGDEKMIAAYDALNDDIKMFNTSYRVAYVHYDADNTAADWIQKYNDVFSPYLTASDAFCLACQEALQGPSADAFAEHIGPYAADAFRQYDSMGQEGYALQLRESQLLYDFKEALGDTSNVTFMHRGKSWTFAQLYGLQGTALSYVEYYEVYYGLCDSLAKQAGPIFEDLVAVRNEIAQYAGYENYNEYAYERMYGRNYTPEDAKALTGKIRDIIAKYSDLSTKTAEPATALGEMIGDADAMLEALHTATKDIDPILDSTWKMLTEYGLYEIGTGSSRTSGGYCSKLPAYGTAVIFLTTDCTPWYNMSSLIHEFGHFSNYLVAQSDNVAVGTESMDVAEIQSIGLEMLALDKYGEIYGENADTMKLAILGDALRRLATEGILTEFEIAIYENPGQSYEEMSLLWDTLNEKYGYSPLGRSNHSWMNSLQFIEKPGYVISYVVSELSAIEIWHIAETDRDAAVDAYIDMLYVCTAGANYFEATKQAGLSDFRTEGFIESLIGDLAAYVNQALPPEENGIEPESSGDTEPSGETDSVKFLDVRFLDRGLL